MKEIISFSEREYGLFINTNLNEGAISLNRESGEILLFEGSGEDCYNSLVISSKNSSGFKIIDNELLLNFRETDHVVGNCSKLLEQATDWVEKANTIISEKRFKSELYSFCQQISLQFIDTPNIEGFGCTNTGIICYAQDKKGVVNLKKIVDSFSPEIKDKYNFKFKIIGKVRFR